MLTESLNLRVLCVLRKEGPGKCSAKEGREEVGMEAIWRLSSFRSKTSRFARHIQNEVRLSHIQGSATVLTLLDGSHAIDSFYIPDALLSHGCD